MAVENTTIARPYAEAIFKLAAKNSHFQQWSDTLSLLSALIQDSSVSAYIGNPALGREGAKMLLLNIAGDNISPEGANLVQLLAENKRLTVLPEIAQLYEMLKAEQEGSIDVTIISAYAVNKAQEKKLAEALRARLGKEIRITLEKDPALIGGVKIRAGDLVIDGSIRNKVARLATVFGI